MHTLIENLPDAKKAFGFATKVVALILLALIICTCSGPKLMLGSQTFEKQTDYSLYSGRHARQIKEVMECATSKIDGLALASCHPQKLLTKQQLRQMLDLEYYQSPELMLKKCLPIKLYPYRLTIHSFSNPYKMEWTGQRQSWPTVSQPPSLQESPSPVQPSPKRSKGSIQQ